MMTIPRASKYRKQHLQDLLVVEGRGLSRVTHDEHPAGTLEFEHTPVPREFRDRVAAAISSFTETPTSSNRSSPTIIEETQSSGPSIVQGIWDHGNTTERSSVDSNYSWDEFDRQAAKTVQILFDEIDSVLYEKRPTKEEYIYNECQEWGSQFPHLRILGKQTLPPQDIGYQMIERDLSRPSTTSSLGLMDVTDQDISQDSQGLSVSGRQVWAIVPPVEARSRSSGTPSTQVTEFSHLEEEIFDSEGEYEEVIAVDYKDIYEDSHSDNKKQLTPRRRRVGYPPVTPNACLKDSVASSAFDCIWHEIISWIRPLMKKYVSIVLDEHKPLIIPIRESSTSLSQTIRLESTPGPPSRENSTLKLPFSRAHTFTGHTVVEPSQLDGVLNITKKVVVKRVAEASDSPLAVTARPASSITLNKQRPVSVRNGTRMRNIRLAPIPGLDRSKTPNVIDNDILKKGVLEVRRINPLGSGRLPSPSAYNPRNGALPPIGSMGIDLDVAPSRQQKKTTSRASSAIEKDPRVPYKDRFVSTQEARPSTTQAMRSDTPNGLRRASTPYTANPFTNAMVSRQPTFGVTGSGLQPASELNPLGSVPLEDQESSLEDIPRPNQWTPSTLPINNPYRRRNRQSSLVRS